MSHAMESNDVQYGLSMAWHKLTTVVEAIREGFKFEYDKKPVAVNGAVVPGWFWLAGSDDGKLIGVPQYQSYSVITNSRFWELVQNALEGTGAKVESLGTFGGRSKRYATIRIGAEWEKFKVDGREFQNFLNIQDAVDGSMPLIAKGANTCIVCANTFAMSLSERGEFKLSLKHTSNMPDRLANFEKTIEAYRGMSALYQRLLESAEETPIDETRANRVFLGYLGEGQEVKTRTMNQANRLTELFGKGAGARGRTMLDVIGAVTDYYTHESSGESENPWKQVTSSEIGAGSRMKSDFMGRIRSDSWAVDSLKLGELVKLGEKTLSLS